MPGVAPRPGDMNGYREFESGHLRTSSYNGHNPYRSEDLDRDPYAPRGRFNGYRDDFDQNSMDGRFDGRNDPSYEVDHLATYNSKSGGLQPEECLSKLKQMEMSTGIWTMRCLLIVERRHLVIFDKGNNEELERFTIDQVHEPTAVVKHDRREIYNNLVLFTVLDDPGRKSAGDMHVFQSVSCPAQDIVDELLAAKGDIRRPPGGMARIPPPPSQPAPEPPYGRFGDDNTTVDLRSHVSNRYKEKRPEPIFVDMQNAGIQITEHRPFSVETKGGGRYRDSNFRASYFHQDGLDTGQNEALERDVQLLNNCFDDIEKFVARLQQAAEAYKELDRRRRERGGKNKKKFAGDGMLGQRAKPPPRDDFIDIFQKFKFAFNLLAKLKAHIHDPNAPELVHFLFTPLSLIYEASRDPIHGGEDLSDKAVAPLLVAEAKQLLLHCLTSKELELWQHLGRSWTTTREEWRGPAPTFNPRFYNGFQPSPQLDGPRMEPPPIAQSRRIEEDISRSRVVDYPPPEDRYSSRGDRWDRSEREPNPYSSRDYRSDIRSSERRDNNPYSGYIGSSHARPPSPPGAGYPEPKREPTPRVPSGPRSRQDEMMSFAEELRRMGATIYEAVHDRQGRNQKELTVEKGDVLQVLDSSRNWWKLKNYKGDIGYAPYTILKQFDDDKGGGRERRLSGDYNSYINNGTSHHQPPPPAPVPPPPIADSHSKHSGRKGSTAAEVPKKGIKSLYTEGSEKREDRRSGSSGSPRSPPPGRRKHENQSSSSSERPPHYASGFNDELLARVSSRDKLRPTPPPRPSGGTPPNIKITPYSSPFDVAEWLENKGFNKRTCDVLNGYSGNELFEMKKKEMERLLGRDEAKHLDSLMTVAKNITGYRTQSAAQLNAILQRRKERADYEESEEMFMGRPPSFMPDSPQDYSPDYSDDEQSSIHSDDFGDAGKTLRHLLERQRRKIQSHQYTRYN